MLFIITVVLYITMLVAFYYAVNTKNYGLSFVLFMIALTCLVVGIFTILSALRVFGG